MKRIALLLIGLLFLSSCVIATPHSRRAYVNANQRLPTQTKIDIINGVVRIGMTKEHVKASWGEPTHHPSRMIFSDGVVQERWRFGPKEITFTNGRVSSIYE